MHKKSAAAIAICQQTRYVSANGQRASPVAPVPEGPTDMIGDRRVDGNGRIMLVTQKKQYALRAIFELAQHPRDEPLKTAEIAEAQAIPVRFLEVIMGQLKRAGLVDSKRGFLGGYTLNRSPARIRVGEIFRLLDQEDNAAGTCMACSSKGNCPFWGDCVFMPLWDRAQRAMDAVYDQTTVQDLIDQASTGAHAPGDDGG